MRGFTLSRKIEKERGRPRDRWIKEVREGLYRRAEEWIDGLEEDYALSRTNDS